jgi:hypothetical protein
MTNYHVVKKLIDRINKLDHSYHYDIFNILCRHNKSYSKNNNGFFFDFQNLEDAIVHDVIQFIDGLEHNLKMNKLSTNTNQFELDIRLQNSHNNQENISNNIVDPKTRLKESTSNSITLQEECMYTLVKLDIDQELQIKPLLSMIDKEKTITKKTTNNRFTLAKKKYSKPVIQETKYTLDDLLVME